MGLVEKTWEPVISPSRDTNSSRQKILIEVTYRGLSKQQALYRAELLRRVASVRGQVESAKIVEEW
jgi:hypothetical protein